KSLRSVRTVFIGDAPVQRCVCTNLAVCMFRAASGEMGKAGRARPRWKDARDETPWGWPPDDSLPLTGDLLPASLLGPERTTTLRIAEAVFIRRAADACQGLRSS